MARMTPEEMEAHIEALEKIVAEQEAQIGPIIQFFNAGKMMGRILFVIGGFIVGLAAVWGVISGWVARHWH